MTTTTTTTTSLKSKRGRKYCPQCNKVNGPRQKICKCGYIFIFKEPTSISATNKSSTKFCPECSQKCGIRKQICKCGHSFKVKKKIEPVLVTEWEKLEKGTIIRVVAGSGPYYLDKNTSVKVPMGESGVFNVFRVLPTGLLCYGSTMSNSGFTFIFMGKPYKSEVTSIYYEPHKISLSKSKK